MRSIRTDFADGYILTKAELVALLGFASKDPTRAHIHALYFQTKPGDRAVAASTDGHRMAVVTGRALNGELLPVLVPRLACEQAAKLAKKGPAVFSPAGTISVFPDVDAQGLPFGVPIVVPFTPETKDFPPYEQVIPHHDVDAPGAAVHLNGSYFADVGLIHAAANPPRASGVSGVTFYPTIDPLDPVVLRCSSRALESEWTAVIMPMRMDGDGGTKKKRMAAIRALLKQEAA